MARRCGVRDGDRAPARADGVGGFGPHNLLEVASNPRAGLAAVRVQLFAVSVCCLLGVAILAARRLRAGPSASPLVRAARRRVRARARDDRRALPLARRSTALRSSSCDGPPSRRSASHPSRSWSGSCTPGSHVRPSAISCSSCAPILHRASSATRLARALRDPSLTLAFWLPDFGSYVDLDGRAVELPRPDARRATTLIDRDGAHVAALLHDPALDDEPELLEAVAAAAGIALENARLHAELRARLEELKGSRARVVEAGQTERQAAGAQPARRRPAAADRPVARAGLARGGLR